MSKLYLRLVTGYRKDQSFSIPEDEAHKLYYLFFNPEARTVFSNGLAIKGADISRIEPDYQASMGWDSTYTLDSYDMNEIREAGMDKKLTELMRRASSIAQKIPATSLGRPFKELLTEQKLIA